MYVKMLVITDGVMPSFREIQEAAVVLRVVGQEDGHKICEIEKHRRRKKGERIKIPDLVL